MVDWTILSPTFLRAVVEWAVTVVIVLAVGTSRSTKDAQGRTRGSRDQRVHRNPATLVTLVVSIFGARSVS